MQKFAFLFLVFLLSVPLAAQAELSPLEIVKKSIAASGGENWRRPKTLQLSGTATLYWNSQPYKMTSYKMWRVFPDENDSARSANGKVRFDAFEGDKLFFQISFDSQKTVQFLSDDAKRQEELLRWSNNFGFSIFRFVESEGFHVVRLPDDKVDDFPCYFVKIIDPKKTETIFGIDKKTFFIRAAFFKTPIGFHQRIYSDFKMNKKPRFVQPRTLRIFVEGEKIADVHWSDFKVNEPIADEIFQISK